MVADFLQKEQVVRLPVHDLFFLDLLTEMQIHIYFVFVEFPVVVPLFLPFIRPYGALYDELSDYAKEY